MELVIKLSQDKPSRIGIKYQYDYQAVRAYEAIFLKQPHGSFSVTMEIIRQNLQLTLISDESGFKLCYKELEYKVNDLKKMQLLQAGSPVQFVHVYPKENNFYVAKPFKKETFIPVSSIQLISPGNNFNDFLWSP